MGDYKKKIESRVTMTEHKRKLCERKRNLADSLTLIHGLTYTNVVQSTVLFWSTVLY
jgi:hypothetical protein